MTSDTQSWYDKPRARTGSHQRLTQDEIDQNGPEEIYSQRGEAPEGYYNAGTVEGGAGFGDHQVFKKLPEAQVINNEPVEEKNTNKDKIKDIAKTQAPVAPSQEVTQAVKRSAAHQDEMQNGDRYGVYGAKKSPFAERSKEIYNPNQGFQSNQLTSVSAEGNQQAQAYMQDRLNKTKEQFNFRPTLS